MAENNGKPRRQHMTWSLSKKKLRKMVGESFALVESEQKKSQQIHFFLGWKQQNSWGGKNSNSGNYTIPHPPKNWSHRRYICCQKVYRCFGCIPSIKISGFFRQLVGGKRWQISRRKHTPDTETKQTYLVGGWTNPFETYARQIGSWNPR